MGRGEREIELTNREFELLEYLMRNQRLVVSRERLLDEVWGYDPMAATNTIDVFISNLRRKLEAEASLGCSTPNAAPVTCSRTRRGAGESRPPGSDACSTPGHGRCAGAWRPSRQA